MLSCRALDGNPMVAQGIVARVCLSCRSSVSVPPCLPAVVAAVLSRTLLLHIMKIYAMRYKTRYKSKAYFIRLNVFSAVMTWRCSVVFPVDYLNCMNWAGMTDPLQDLCSKSD